ncbi:F-box protein At5g07610-like [Herrania umbratica]|uniref:F-box protein At5g07610-like n=1 Tax=Herrania umbratica TaxID=108875 RepID=A0A6J1A7T4_9ROSI|nr:F-box protein At5g07610-like [Herrania umbratica]
MSSTISPAADAIASNEDLLTEILLRLPAKPLLKFKSVSKEWFSLISSSQFCLFHNRRYRDNASLTAAVLLFDCGTTHTPPTGFHIVPSKNQCSKVPFFEYLGDSDFRIMQSCNGLLLCRCCDKFQYLNYFIFNPSTNKIRIVSFPQAEVEGFVYAVNLAFDPLKSVHYKIISIRRLVWVAPRFQIDIYSSKTDSWSVKVLNFTKPDDVWLNCGVFCNGAIHWEGGGRSSLYLDVENMCLKAMPTPARMLDAPEGSYSESNRFLGESRGHLHLAVNYMPLCLQFNIFEMAADYSDWFLKYRMNLETVVKGFPEIHLYPDEEGDNQVSAMCVIRSKIDEVSTVVVFVNGKVISYDLHDGTSTKLCDLESCPKTHGHLSDYEAFHVYQYFETLSCV